MLVAIKDLPDDLLIKKHQQGDSAAYDILFKRYYTSLFNYAIKNLPDGETAEELTMDVMLRLWQKKESIIIDTDLRPYLYRSVKNAIYNYHRKKILATVSIDIITTQLIPSANSTADKLGHLELEKLYHQKLSELSPQRQKVFRMSREENMTYAQIAKSMGLSVNTVENYMAASLSFFRKHLKEHADHIVVITITFFFY